MKGLSEKSGFETTINNYNDHVLKSFGFASKDDPSRLDMDKLSEANQVVISGGRKSLEGWAENTSFVIKYKYVVFDIFSHTFIPSPFRLDHRHVGKSIELVPENYDALLKIMKAFRGIRLAEQDIKNQKINK